MRTTVEPAWLRDFETTQEARRATRNRSETRTGGIVSRLLGLVRRCTMRNDRLQLCETLSLGGRRSVALIECDGQRFLAGMSANAVETLVPVGNAARAVDAR